MSLTPLVTYSRNQLQPAFNDEDARMLNVNLVASTTYARGQILGEITDTEANAVQTITTTGVPTGGTLVLLAAPYPYSSGVSPLITLPYNASAAQAQPLFDAVYGPGNTVVTGGPLPTGLVVTYTGALSAQPIVPITVSANNLTGGTTPAGVVTQTTTGVLNTGTFGKYAHGNSDGTQIAKAILMYACVTDALGNITIGADGGGSDIPGYTEIAMPAYIGGAFRTEDLVGLPSSGNLATDFPGARVVMGDLTSGILVLPV